MLYDINRVLILYFLINIVDYFNVYFFSVLIVDIERYYQDFILFYFKEENLLMFELTFYLEFVGYYDFLKKVFYFCFFFNGYTENKIENYFYL